jgi:sporulation protein YqfC
VLPSRIKINSAEEAAKHLAVCFFIGFTSEESMHMADNLERGNHMLFSEGADWMQNRKWLQRLTDEANLPGESLPGIPVIEIAGDGRVLIERHKGVIEYCPRKIGVQMCYGKIEVCGCDLVLSSMTKEQLVISGRIYGVQIYRSGKG